jgi:hypothetical protein
MPTFTNTELIAGTHTSAAQKPVEPEDIAAAVVKVLDKPTTLVSVPAALRFVSAVTPTLSPKARRWLSHKWATRPFSWTSTARRGKTTSSVHKPRKASSRDRRTASRIAKLSATLSLASALAPPHGLAGVVLFALGVIAVDRNV